MQHLIDANALCNKAEEMYIHTSSGKIIPVMAVPVWEVNNIPTIEAEPVRHGRWIKNEWVLNRVTCSECKCYFDSLEADLYCPNCGSKMDLEV